MNVKLGLEIVNHAVKHDNEERIQEATYLYDIAIEFFKKALQEDLVPASRNLILSKIQDYEKRSLRLKNPNLKNNASLSSASSVQVNENLDVQFPPTPRVTTNSPKLPQSLPTNNEKQTPRETSSKLAPSPIAPLKSLEQSKKSGPKIFGEPKTKSFILSQLKSDQGLSVESIEVLTKAAESEASKDPMKAISTFKIACEKLISMYKDLEKSKESKSIRNSKSSKHELAVKLGKTPKLSIDFLKDEVVLHERLGGGGSGAQIYRVTASGFTFAAKILATETVGEVIDAIKREIYIMERLDHPNIVKYLAHDASRKGEIRLYMEYYTGTLHDVIQSKKASRRELSLQEVVNYTFQIAKGLNYLHNFETPIIHRDLKSENIFVTLDSHRNVQTLKIGDFDTSKIMEKSKFTFTKNIGTEGYSAPEVSSGSQGYSAKADVYSLGMVMYELMALEKPFANVHSALRWECTLQGKIPELSSEAQTKFKPLLDIWLKCIHIDADARPPAKKLIKKLSEFL